MILCSAFKGVIFQSLCFLSFFQKRRKSESTVKSSILHSHSEGECGQSKTSDDRVQTLMNNKTLCNNNESSGSSSHVAPSSDSDAESKNVTPLKKRNGLSSSSASGGKDAKTDVAPPIGSSQTCTDDLNTETVLPPMKSPKTFKERTGTPSAGKKTISPVQEKPLSLSTASAPPGVELSMAGLESAAYVRAIIADMTEDTALWKYIHVHSSTFQC